ncbi:Uncharacterized protein Fot_16543 [Forsythia ovata]|uniref:Ribosomal protein S10 n=1 Tax=Forsythia ovata TaxID=205694 RepID=A0ABD1WG06_9LAMI
MTTLLLIFSFDPFVRLVLHSQQLSKSHPDPQLVPPWLHVKFSDRIVIDFLSPQNRPIENSHFLHEERVCSLSRSSKSFQIFTRIKKENRAARVLENFEEGEQYAQHSLRKFLRGRRPEVKPKINKFFSDPK